VQLVTREPHRICAGVAVALALALGACRGPSVIVLGAADDAMPGPIPMMAFLSPTGNNSDDGTQLHPWKTFKWALPRLQPGSTLTLLDGTYDGEGTGYLNVTCDPAATAPSQRSVKAANGTATMPIVVKAANERKAFLHGDPSGPPFSIDACSFWQFSGLHVESGNFQDAPDTADAGSVIVVGEDNHDLTFSRMLVAHPNLYKHSHVFRIGDRSTNITVEDSELYFFHHNAFETSRTTSVKFLRNYINSLGTADIAGGYQSIDGSEGDYGIFLEETNSALVANNIIESVGVGIAVMGRFVDVPSDTPAVVITGNQIVGNIVYGPGTSGLVIDSRCNGDAPCLNPATKVTNTLVANDAFVQGAAGISSAGAIATTVQQVSVIDAGSGVRFVKELDNVGIQSTSTTSNTFARVQAVAFIAQNETSWEFDTCEAISANGTNHEYQPDDASTSNKQTVDPMLGGCLVYLPANSPLQRIGTGGKALGANVLTRYDDDGQPTPMPLWNATTGAFLSCGVVVDINATPGKSCSDVNQRLHVAAVDCPLP
jgi:hypothetical protein